MSRAIATTERRMTADEALAEIEARRIGLTCALKGKSWLASCVLFSPRNSGRSVERTVTGIASSPLAAVEALLAKLAAEPTARSLFDEPSFLEDVFRKSSEM